MTSSRCASGRRAKANPPMTCHKEAGTRLHCDKSVGGRSERYAEPSRFDTVPVDLNLTSRSAARRPF